MPRSYAPANVLEPQRSALRHTFLEDAQPLLPGAVFCAFGVYLLTAADPVTGQNAGLGLLISYVTPLLFGMLFFELNLPFRILGWARMRPFFVVGTLVVVIQISALTWSLPSANPIGPLDAFGVFALSGAVIGMGLVVIVGHAASLYGIGIHALWLQEGSEVRAKWVQLGYDAVQFSPAILLLNPSRVAASPVSAVIMNRLVPVNRRRDR